ncbi:ATPase with chaperone activity [Striga asiatica]|uniref:ATPase with chaperone activity n=1 Tax=Striga asiatica TaxID=4170 RepID=A0A5A7PR77_STRAF|nr:ATPase with chaperone activity [Striga asiatica]
MEDANESEEVGGLELVPVAESSQMADKGAEKDMDVESSAGQLIENKALEKHPTTKVGKGTRIATTWKRRAATEGRLVRMEVQNQVQIHSNLVNPYQSSPQQSLKRNREIINQPERGNGSFWWIANTNGELAG